MDFYTTVLSTSATAGVAIGSLFGGDFVKDGRRRAVINFNIVGLIGSILTLQLSFNAMVVGRFILGISCGVLLCATSKLMDETIPAKLID